MYTPKRQCHSPAGTERLSGTVCSDTTQKLLRDRPKNVDPAYRFSKSVFEGSSAGSAAEYFSKTQAADVSLWPYSVGHVLPRVTCKLDEFGSVSQASNVYWTECLNSKLLDKTKCFNCWFGRWMFRSAVDRRNDDRGSVVKAWSKSARLAKFLISSRCWWEIW